MSDALFWPRGRRGVQSDGAYWATNTALTESPLFIKNSELKGRHQEIEHELPLIAQKYSRLDENDANTALKRALSEEMAARDE